MPNKTFVVTGTAGFIGYHLAELLLGQGYKVVGIDIVSDYYDVSLKEARLKKLLQHESFIEKRIDLADWSAIEAVFKEHRPNYCVNLAAQAGVRYSLENPRAYLKSNVDGFLNILEACRHYPVEHLVYASTSSAYGANTSMPFKVSESAEHPMTLYAATKKSNEMMAHSYSHLFNIPSTGMRFFTVYGPWGRPDMALFMFTRDILAGKPINVFNNGNMQRDFTYVKDIVEGISRLTEVPPSIDKNWDSDNPNPNTSGIAPYRVVNIGNTRCEKLMRYIEILEEKLGVKAEYNMLPMQDGDVPATWADVTELTEITGYTPSVTIEEGIGHFVDWYKSYYKINS
ncbi:capsular biosynthesis protein CpsI [Kiloniella litopenaei]|uniref:Capsular biosynthesis protein CpsI n=1 Tax=Kiloniella litopenaei TaxID=1549748 RepID=A0A0M2RBL5_9PROT|nr:NAD-dependent epimerase [Kiloniella litopenaei]KKJ77008.1 capsular biosynthesis protein CpsI [Kiloniella litopenaei]